AFVGFKLVDDRSIKAHRAGLALERPANAIDQCRLPRAVGPNQPDALSRHHLEIDSLERHEAAEALAQTIDGEQSIGHGADPFSAAGATFAWRGLRMRPPMRQAALRLK